MHNYFPPVLEKLQQLLASFLFVQEHLTAYLLKILILRIIFYLFTTKGSRDKAKRFLLLAIKPIKSVSIKKELDQFIHIEVTSRIFGFVDDVEFYLNEPGIIHFRSASRIGYSDLGVNRERMETIRKTFQNLQE